MPPPLAQTFALDSASRSLGGSPSSYALERPGWRRFQAVLAVVYVALGASYLLRGDPDVFMGCVFLVIGVIQMLQVNGILKRSVTAPTVTLDGDGIRYDAPAGMAEQHAAWAEIETVTHRAGRIVLSRRGGALPIVIAFADVTYAEARAIKEATDAWARHEQVPLL